MQMLLYVAFSHPISTNRLRGKVIGATLKTGKLPPEARLLQRPRVLLTDLLTLRTAGRLEQVEANCTVGRHSPTLPLGSLTLSRGYSVDVQESARIAKRRYRAATAPLHTLELQHFQPQTQSLIWEQGQVE